MRVLRQMLSLRIRAQPQSIWEGGWVGMGQRMEGTGGRAALGYSPTSAVQQAHHTPTLQHSQGHFYSPTIP